MNGHMYRPYFWIEILYSILAIGSFLLIYLKTREMHRLTDHKGIKYFSYTFLFFALAHLLRFFYRIFFRFFSPGFYGAHLTLGGVFFIYTSVMAGLFLLYSLVWRKLKWKETVVILLFNLLAFLTIMLDFFSGNPFIHIIIITVLFSATVFVSYFRYKKKHPFFIAYVLIFFSWILNLISIEILRFFTELRILINAISLVLILIILWRVHK